MQQSRRQLLLLVRESNDKRRRGRSLFLNVELLSSISSAKMSPDRRMKALNAGRVTEIREINNYTKSKREFVRCFHEEPIWPISQI